MKVLVHLCDCCL